MNTWSATSLAVVIAAGLLCANADGAESGAKEAETAEVVAAPSDGDSKQARNPDGAANPVGKDQSKELRIELSLYTWLSSLSTDIEVRGTEVTSDVDFSSILDALDFANFAHFEVQRGKWGLFSEIDFIKLSEDTEFRRPGSGVPFKIHADGVLKETMIELGAIRSFEGNRAGFDVLAGARYFRLESDVRIGPFESSISKDWVDPLIGGRLRYRLSDKWLASLRADLAGFGAGSELTTNIVATVGYDISDRYALRFGYRYMDLNYEKDALEMSTTTHGPMLGMSIRF
mgnify:CR=1 FL=1